MRSLLRTRGFLPFMAVVLLNAVTDLGHKIVIQNTVFKAFDGPTQILLTAVVNGLILLPFILLFSPSGFISDRFPKHTVIKACAFVTLPLSVAILLCYRAGLFWPAFAMTFLLAAQSAVYSPAKYGYIKEMVGKENLARANAAVQAVTIVAILLGGVVYSVLFEHLLDGGEAGTAQLLSAIAPCGWVLIAGAAVEFLAALALPKRGGGDAGLTLDLARYARAGYLRDNLGLLLRNRTIWLSVVGLAVFWAVNQVLLAAFGAHLKAGVGETNTVVAQALLGLGGLGLVLGSVAAGRASRNYIETGLIPAAALGMTACLFLLPDLEGRLGLGALMLAYGVFGGMFVVPLNALIQFNARDQDLGRVLAGNNFIQNVAMLAFLGLTVAAAVVGLGSITLFRFLGLVVLAGMLYTVFTLPQSLLRYLLRLLVSQRFNLSVSGLNHVPSTGGVLLLGNHTSWLDWAILYLAMPRRMRFVMDRDIYSRWYWRGFLRRAGAIPISPRAHRTALKDVAAALNDGQVVVLFPEGAISRNGQLGAFKRGFEEAAGKAGCAIVPFYLRGLWGSSFSFAAPRFRASSRTKRVRDVSVCFGEPLPNTAKAQEVKDAVHRLSITAWRDYSDTFETLPRAWLRTAKRDLSAPAVTDSDGTALTSLRLLAASLAASRLFGRMARGQEAVGVLLPASSAGAMANLALLVCGKAVVNLNYTMAPATLRQAMDRAGVSLVVTSERFLARLKAKGLPVAEALEGRTVFPLEELRGRLGRAALARAALLARLLPAWALRLLYFARAGLDDTAAILFSSGSEGAPKGVMLSHRNLVGNIRQVANLFNAREDDVFLGALPLFHAFGLTITTFMPLVEGIPLVCHPDPTDAVRIGRVVARHQVTFLCGTPTFLGIYTRHRRLPPLMFASLRLVVAGAERLPEEVRKAFKQKFGHEVYEGYGTTETTPVASVNVPDVMNARDFTVQTGSKAGTVGLPLPGSAFRIVDPATLEDLPQGEAGLVLIGGTQIMKGYLGDPERTAQAIAEADGVRWYKTGDKGLLDEDGFLVIQGRYSRFAKIGGEMVSLGAVEEALLRAAPEGADAVAVALPDPRKGERVLALVQGVEDPAGLKAAMLGAGVSPLLVPAAFLAVPELPKLGTGKKDYARAKELARELAA